MSHTTPVTHLESTPPHRCYVVFYFEGKRQRIYNGKGIGKNCNPNHQTKLTDRKRELARLCKLVTEALSNGWYPGKPLEEKKPVEREPLAVEVLQKLKTRYARNGWSSSYKRDMDRITDEFIGFLNLEHPLKPLSQILPEHLADFLDTYRSSGRYFMNKRRNLSAVYSLLQIEPNPVGATPTMKVTEHLNEAYKPEEMMTVLQFIQKVNPNLYLCALLTYGTLLRPHREIRLLRRIDLDDNLDFILLKGSAVKNGKIRKVPIPGYVKSVLQERQVLTL